MTDRDSKQIDEKSLKELKRRTASGIAWTAAQNVGSRLMGSVFFIFMARLLDPEKFGLMAAALVFLAISDLLMEQGFGKAIIQREDLRPEHLDTVFWTQLTIAVVGCGIGVVIAPWLAGLYGLPQLTEIIRVILFMTPISALGTVQESLLMRDLHFKKLAKRRLIAGLIGGVIAVAMALGGFGVWSLVGQQMIGGVIAVALLWKASQWRPRYRFSFISLRDLMGFSVNLLIQRGLTVIKSRADHFLIGLFLGPVVLGLYTMAYRVVDLSINLFVDTFSRFTLPLFSRLQSDSASLRRAYLSALFAAGIFGFPTTAGLAVLAPEAVQVALGQQWIGVIPLLQILSLLVFERTIGAANTAVILAKGQSFLRLIVVTGYFIISLLLVIFYVEKGVTVISWLNVACAIGILPIYIWMVHKLIGLTIRHYLQTILSPIAATFAMVVVIIPLKAALIILCSPAFVMLIVVLVGAGVYCTVLSLVSAEFRRVASEVGKLLWIRLQIRQVAPANK